jgi:hypothetical protein
MEEFFGVGLLRSNPHEIDVAVPISATDYRQYSNALTKCGRLHDRLAFELVERNLIDLRSLCSFTAITLTLPRAFASADRVRMSRVVMGQTINWLTAVRLFVDHAATDLTGRFGPRSAQVARFKQLREEAYQRSFAYRFVWKLRDYVQHCGWPLSSMSMLLRPSVPGTVFRDVQFLLDPQALLKAYNSWGPVKKDLRATTASFALLDIAEQAMEELRQLAHELLLVDIADAADSVGQLEDALKRLGPVPDAYHPSLIRGLAASDGSMVSVTPAPINRELVTRLSQIAAGTEEPEDLISESEKPVLPTFNLDPQTVVARLTAESRGVQLMAAFMEEGSGTPAFVDLVNSVIASDGGVQPLVDGLINVSAVLLYMTAGALGAEPKGLLNGLREHYRPPEDRPETSATPPTTRSPVDTGGTTKVHEK